MMNMHVKGKKFLFGIFYMSQPGKLIIVVCLLTAMLRHDVLGAFTDADSKSSVTNTYREGSLFHLIHNVNTEDNLTFTVRHKKNSVNPDHLKDDSSDLNDLFELEARAVSESSMGTVADEAIPIAIRALLNPNTENDVRQSAVRLLDHAGALAAEYIPELIDQLSYINSDIRWRISRVFVESMQFDPGLKDLFTSISKTEDDASLREYAIRILAASFEAEQGLTDLFLDIAKEDEDTDVRQAAFRALEETAYNDSNVIQLFVSQLDDHNDTIRLIASRGLERAGSYAKEAVPHLLAALTSEDVHPHIRLQLWRSLLSIASDDERISGSHVHRGHRADEDDLIPGLRLRLSEMFQEEAKYNTYQPKGLSGTSFFSTRGWRGDEVMIPAFPEAQGFGMWTPGGRGGVVYRVTTLEDGGEGSLREAVNANEPRIIIFDIAGTIQLQESLIISSPYLTIAGQTAPGDGITLAGAHVHLGTNDVILRNLRFRPGSGSQPSDKGLNVRYSDNVIVDQVSGSWAMEEVLSVVESSRVTVQRSFITHPLVTPERRPDGRGFGSLVRGSGPGRQDYAQGSNYSYINNLWAHCRSRAPRPGNYVHYEEDPVGPLFDFRNNVIYNWGRDRAGDNYDNHSISRYNFIGNYYKPGPNTVDLYAFNNDAPHARAHWSGNSMDGSEPEDQWSIVMGYTDEPKRRKTPFKAGYVNTLSAAEAYEYVLANGGAHPRDTYDQQIVHEVRSGTGNLIDEDIEAGGLPDLRPALNPVDTNDNGIPDWWQIQFGLGPESELNPASDMNGSGYTNIEEYLNGTDLEKYIEYKIIPRH